MLCKQIAYAPTLLCVSDSVQRTLSMQSMQDTHIRACRTPTIITVCCCRHLTTAWKVWVAVLTVYVINNRNTHCWFDMQAAQHAKLAKNLLTSDQESGAVGAKLVPEGGEEVDELEHLGAGLASCQGSPEAGGHQEEHKACQEAQGLQPPHS